jgi:D-mannonate dehydratase
MFFHADREQAAHRLQEARHGTGDVDMIGIMIAMAQFDACTKAKKEKNITVKIDSQCDTMETET